MTIILKETFQPCLIKAGGQDGIVLTEGKRLKIETSPDGEEILNAEVPVGKVWDIDMDVQIRETDA